MHLLLPRCLYLSLALLLTATGCDLGSSASTPVTATVVDSRRACADQNPLQAMSRPGAPIHPLPVPAYPGAYNVQSKELHDVYEDPPGTPFMGNDSLIIGTQVTTFETQDKPEVVLQFYKESLKKDGWKTSKESSSSTDIVFSWSSTSGMWAALPCPPTPPCCQPIYGVRLIFKQSGKMTEVEIREGYIPGM